MLLIRQLMGLYLAMLLVAEVVTAIVDVQLGLLLHGVLLAFLYLYASSDKENSPNYAWLVSLTFPPLIRLVSLALPLNSFDRVMIYVITGLPLLISGFIAICAFQVEYSKIGLQWRPFVPQIIIALTAIPLGYIQYYILRPQPLVQNQLTLILVSSIILLIFTGLVEELIFRGIMQWASIEILGRWYGIGFVTVIFMIMHISFRSIPHLTYVGLTGLFFAIVVDKYHRITGVAFAHGFANVLALVILPLVRG